MFSLPCSKYPCHSESTPHSARAWPEDRHAKVRLRWPGCRLPHRHAKADPKRRDACSLPGEREARRRGMHVPVDGHTPGTRRAHAGHVHSESRCTSSPFQMDRPREIASRAGTLYAVCHSDGNNRAITARKKRQREEIANFLTSRPSLGSAKAEQNWISTKVPYILVATMVKNMIFLFKCFLWRACGDTVQPHGISHVVPWSIAAFVSPRGRNTRARRCGEKARDWK